MENGSAGASEQQYSWYLQILISLCRSQTAESDGALENSEQLYLDSIYI